METEIEEKKLTQRVVELELKIKELENDLIHDPLTGLKTRNYFEEECSAYLSLIEKYADTNRRELFGFKNLTLLFFDLDHFKNVNDTYGHQTGDLVLRKVAETIKESLREEDTTARWGGEEFITLMLGANEDDGKRKADEIREKVSGLTFDFDPNFRITISIGVANTTRGMKYDDFLKMSDDALYRAKDTGRDKVVSYSEL